MDVTALLNTVAGAVAIAAFLALILERITEAFVSPIYSVLQKFLTGEASKEQPYMVYVTLALGVLIAYAFSVDAVTPTLTSLGQEIPARLSGAGWLLTGVIMGGGSNFLHDIWPGSSARNGG